MNIEPYKPPPEVEPLKNKKHSATVEPYRPPALQTVKPAETNDDEEFDWKKLLVYFNIIRRRKLLIIQCTLIVLLLGFIVTKMMTPLYKATSNVIILPRPVSVQRQGQEETTVFIPSISIESQIQMIKNSGETGESISKSLKEKNKINMTPGEIMDTLSVKKIKDTEMVEIVSIHKDPEIAKLIANYGAEQFRERNKQFDSVKLKQSRDMVQEQLAMVEKDLKSAEEKLKIFQQKEGLIDEQTEVQAKLTKVIELEASKAEAEVEKNVAEAKYKEAQANLGSMRIDEKDPTVSALEGQLANLEVELAGLKEKWADDYPEILNTKAKIEETRRKLREALAAQGAANKNQMLINNSVEYTGAQAKTSGLSQMYEKESSAMKNMPEKIIEMKRLKRQVEITEEKYRALLEKSQQAKIMEADRQGNVEVGSYALLPESPYMPDVKKNMAIALLLGLCIGICAALAMEQLDVPLSNEEDIGSHLHLPVLEVIPKIKFSKKSAEKPSLINVDEKDRRYVFFLEAFRTLRTVLNFSMKDEVLPGGRNVKILLVTSSVPGEGKSTIAGNLAISYAQMGKKVLLIEADLLRPTIRKYFNIETHNNGKGMTELLSGKEFKLSDLAHETFIPNLKVLTSGKNIKFTSELFESDSMKDFIRNLQSDEDTDLVIFDSPPCQAVSDGVILSSLVDKVLLVVSTGMNARTVRQSIKLLNSAQADIIGVVLNKMDTSRGSYYSYKYKYGYYYSRDKKASEAKLDEILEEKKESVPELEDKEKSDKEKSDVELVFKGQD